LEAAVNVVEVWVKSKCEMRERLKREKEVREHCENAMVCFQPLTFGVDLDGYFCSTK